MECLYPFCFRFSGLFMETDCCYHQGSVISPVAKTPAGSSLLFGAHASSGRIKQRKNDGSKLVMQDVERVHWETDDAEAKEGYCNTRNYAN